MKRRLLTLPWVLRWAVLVGGWVLAALALGLIIRYLLAPRITARGERLSWFDWTTLAGVVLTVAGLAVTFGQVLQAQSAAEAARNAVDRALLALGKSDLLVDFQTMRQLEYDLDKTEGANKETVQSLIRQVREVGAQISAALKKKDPDDPLIAAIEAVRETASEARVVIMGGRKNLNLWNVTRKLRQELVPTCDKISTRMNELKLDVGKEADV